MNLRAFQRRFLSGALAPGVRTSALSLPRANGKTTLASMLAYRVVSPRSSLFRRGTESHLVSSSLGQSRRTAFRLLKALVESRPDAESYRVSENRNECAVTHLPTDTRISVLAPKAATAQGLVGCPWVIGDEPGSPGTFWADSPCMRPYSTGDGQAVIAAARSVYRNTRATKGRLVAVARVAWKL